MRPMIATGWCRATSPRRITRGWRGRLAFTPTGEIEERRRHVELEARNRAGETLTLHIDRAGVIYKQVWQR